LIGDRSIEAAFRAKAIVLLADEHDRLVPASARSDQQHPRQWTDARLWCRREGRDPYDRA
jgi:hypothetical protein